MRFFDSFMRTGTVLLLAFVGCDSGGTDRYAICLYELAKCEYGALGGVCPPRLSDYETQCVDLPKANCPSSGNETEVDTQKGQAYVEYVANPRIVEDVTCQDYRETPALDPEPWQTVCLTEMNGVCDAPKNCPDGTDIVDCAGAPCEETLPDDYDCGMYDKNSFWCTNYEGGSRCAEVGSLYYCDGDVWMQASVAEIDSVCHTIGSIGYYGCSGAFDEFIGYCR